MKWREVLAAVISLMFLCCPVLATTGPGSSPSGAASKVYTLAAPGDYTNLLVTIREFASDKSIIRQTRIWIAGRHARVLQQETPNTNGVESLLDVPGQSWSRMEMVFEMVRSDVGTFVRRQWTPDWDRIVREAEQQAKAMGASFTAARPEDWNPADGMDERLSRFYVGVDPELRMKSSRPGAVLDLADGQFSYPTERDGTNGTCELQFDPHTHLKLVERQWVGGQLVEDIRVQTNMVRDVEDFQEPTRAQVQDYLRWEQARRETGLGLALQAATQGPYVIREVYDGSPGDLAGIERNSLLIGLNGRSVREMPSAEFAPQWHSQYTNEATIDVQAPSGEIRTYHLRAAEYLRIPQEYARNVKNVPNYRGLVLMERQTGPFPITEVLSNSPASMAQIPADSFITGINGKSTAQMSIDEFARIMRSRPDAVILEVVPLATREPTLYRLKPGPAQEMQQK